MILNGWAVREGYDNSVYFSGMNEDNRPLFQPIGKSTRVYKSELGAKVACHRIRDTGYEGSPEPYLLDGIQVADEAPEQETPPEEKPSFEQIITEVEPPPEGWRILDCFGRYLALMYNGTHYIIRTKDGHEQYDNCTVAADMWCKLRSATLKARLKKLGGAG